ncbi:hypothetical protein NDU88_001820 [Pleurodeles waltl]|uniref:Uncharacterized protein n=1 Tax=Pleurodeles waltl TaxID=8319 RepID=A0AAV7T0T3_PLEWA|nr:hypothetical protein NDU88_001820 [Pleurodeles waltl]
MGTLTERRKVPGDEIVTHVPFLKVKKDKKHIDTLYCVRQRHISNGRLVARRFSGVGAGVGERDCATLSRSPISITGGMRTSRPAFIFLRPEPIDSRVFYLAERALESLCSGHIAHTIKKA